MLPTLIISKLNTIHFIRCTELIFTTLVLVFAYSLNYVAIIATTDASRTALGSVPFFIKLNEVVSEIKILKSLEKPDFQAMATASPIKGLRLDNVWAAHATKRAWAVKGVNLNVKGGEVLLLIGEDGSGKSRLLTVISELLMNIPKNAKTTIPVKGKVSVGGLDVQMWDRDILRSKLGLVLSDVSSTSDTAKIYSGMSIDEILDPTNGSDTSAFRGNHDSKKAADSIKVALQVSLS